jgi:hydrogenase/urease accessory protein HupE
MDVVDALHVERLLLDSFVIQGCARQPGAAVQPDGADGISVSALWLCPQPPDQLRVRVGFHDSFPIGHVHLSRVSFAPDEVSQRAAQVEEPSFEVQRVRSVQQEFARFLRMGVEHIFTGYDHIAFLIGLLLLGGSLKTLVKIVTAFTLAHSVTLALAALDIVAPTPRIVEPLIAASIVFIGVENLVALRKGASEAALRHRWMVTLAFGLIHGFGFASVLRELQLPRAVLATGLVSFNLGVEVGQLVIVALALPLLRRLRTWAVFAPAASACIATLGAAWLIQRCATVLFQ